MKLMQQNQIFLIVVLALFVFFHLRIDLQLDDYVRPESQANATQANKLIRITSQNLITEAIGAMEDAAKVRRGSEPPSYSPPNVYNLGDLLNLPSFQKEGAWSKGGNAYVDTTREVASHMPGSIVGIYAELENFEDCYTIKLNNQTVNRTRCDIFPNQKILQRAVKTWGERNARKAAAGMAVLKGNNTLLVHLRTGDRGGNISANFKAAFSYLCNLATRIVIIAGVHDDLRYSTRKSSLARLAGDLMFLKQNISSNIDFFPHSDADLHIYMMQNAERLLLHKGGFSALGAIVSKGTVYYTKEFDDLYYVDSFGNLFEGKTALMQVTKTNW